MSISDSQLLKALPSSKEREGVDARILEEVPSYLSMLNVQTFLEAREQVVREIRDLEAKKKRNEEELFDLDFHADYRLDSIFQPMGVKLLKPCDKELVGHGQYLDIRQVFRTTGHRDRATEFGKSLVDGKVTEIVQGLMKINALIQRSKNYRAIASLNELLSIMVRDVAIMETLSKANPKTFPPINSEIDFEKNIYSSNPQGGVPTQDMPGPSSRPDFHPYMPSFWKGDSQICRATGKSTASGEKSIVRATGERNCLNANSNANFLNQALIEEAKKGGWNGKNPEKAYANQGKRSMLAWREKVKRRKMNQAQLNPGEEGWQEELAELRARCNSEWLLKFSEDPNADYKAWLKEWRNKERVDL